MGNQNGVVGVRRPPPAANRRTAVTASPKACRPVWLDCAYLQAMGLEQRTKGTNVMLGPGVNLARVPWGGRNFEYMGEDPYLASQLVGPEVMGVQSSNISGGCGDGDNV